jgi:DNA-directed RNA polymerase I subunit RPA49
VLNPLVFAVSFPALEPPKSISFRCYQRKKRKADILQEEGEEDFAKQDILLAGETKSVEFFSSDETRRASAGCRRVR